MKKASMLSLGLALLIFSVGARSSDHADPITLPVLESGLTDLHAFPEDDQMIVVLATRRALTAPPPYQLEPYEYAIHMDLHSQMSYENAEDRARYGGTIVQPEGISPDVTIKIRFNNDATLKEKSFEGLTNPDSVRLWAGVKDDPFIFPRFFERNAIVMVLSIPFAAFPAGQQDWLLWGTATRLEDGVQIDHVGRSNRTQLARFDFLNTLPPSQHAAAIKEKNTSRERIMKLLMDCIPPAANLYQTVFTLRHYDYVPDVMIFTKRYPVGFPNGRRLTDDVALLTCQQGDCPLIEASYGDTKQWPRATRNDKPFGDEFPYLAEPWPAKPSPPAASGPGMMCMMILMAVPVLLVVIIVWLFIRCRRKRAKA